MKTATAFLTALMLLGVAGAAVAECPGMGVHQSASEKNDTPIIPPKAES